MPDERAVELVDEHLPSEPARREQVDYLKEFVGKIGGLRTNHGIEPRDTVLASTSAEHRVDVSLQKLVGLVGHDG